MFFKILDSRGLNIKAVIDQSNGQKLDYSIGEEGYVGSKLEVTLPITKDKKYIFNII
jgi:hypothetical protein